MIILKWIAFIYSILTVLVFIKNMIKSEDESERLGSLVLSIFQIIVIFILYTIL